MKKYIRVLLLAALVCSLLAGCSIETKSSKDSQDESKYHLYYLNESETVLREEPYSPGEETADFMVKDLMQKLGSKDAPDGEISLLPEDVSINSYEVQKDLLVIDFSKEYSKIEQDPGGYDTRRSCADIFVRFRIFIKSSLQLEVSR